LAIILVGCVAFVSCDRAQQVLEPAADDMMDDGMAADDMMTDMMMDMTAHKSWAHVMLPAPGPMAEAMSPAETGAAHNPGSDVTTPRTVYINDIGALANKAGTAYPAGTMIVKEIMDDTNMFVDKVAMMMKSDDPMYAGHNGWVYEKYARASQDAAYMQVRGSNLEDAGNGCHGCHAKAANDSVFVSLSMGDDMMAADDHMAADDAGMADDMAADDHMAADDAGMADDAGAADSMADDTGMADDAGAAQ